MLVGSFEDFSNSWIGMLGISETLGYFEGPGTINNIKKHVLQK